MESDAGTDIAGFHETGGFTSYLKAIFNAGVQIGASTKIDSMQYKASGDSLQIFINGTGWKAFKLNSSSGN